ncbi:mitochondrial protein Pet127-domain-containing protein [Lipomyces arxii]|uniref:mitochondrial protein Pet127-domain-containing protein n=1 Tax=Lipomyces arxii TaxID=56418 RepID=UPI0034CE400A
MRGQETFRIRTLVASRICARQRLVASIESLKSRGFASVSKILQENGNSLASIIDKHEKTVLTNKALSKQVQKADVPRIQFDKKNKQVKSEKYAKSQRPANINTKPVLWPDAKKSKTKTRPTWELPSSLRGESKDPVAVAEEEAYDFDAPPNFEEFPFQGISLTQYHLTAIDVPSEAHIVPPSLAHGIDRVLFNPGVHLIQDPRSRVYNFPPAVKDIMPVNEFDFDALPKYHISSSDPVLPQVAKDNGLNYFVSTSSLTSTLSQFHFLLSRNRPLNAKNLTRNYEGQLEYSKAASMASSIFLKYMPKSGRYAIDIDKSGDTDIILMYLGRSMELQLVKSPEEYEKYRIKNSHLLSPDEKKEREAYHYSKCGDFLLRSQQDCMDPRLPGTGTFDLKTRAVAAVRYDIKHMNQVGKTGYQLKTLYGQYESFESEYADLIRTSFLKYSMQARIGRMDGILLAYHNMARIFGFQYVPLEEMDLCIHGENHKFIAQQEFETSIAILNNFVNQLTKKHPQQVCFKYV